MFVPANIAANVAPANMPVAIVRALGDGGTKV